MSSKPFRYNNWEVVEGPRAWRVRNARSGRVFQVLIHRIGSRRETGDCSCGARATENPSDHCEHQRAAYELVGKQWLQGHFGAGAYDLQQQRADLFAALRSAARRGHLECPHCHSTITAHDLAPDRFPQPKPTQAKLHFEPAR